MEYVHDEKGRKVCLWPLFERPVWGFMTHFWSSHVFNLATWEAIYCLFPEATMQNRMMHIFPGRPWGSGEVLERWFSRGFSRAAGNEKFSSSEFQSERYFGDSMTYRLGFSKSDGVVPEVLRQVRISIDRNGSVCIYS